jgi:hypothetical protein
MKQTLLLLLLLVLLIPVVARAQTAITIPAATGAGILRTGAKRPGLVLSQPLYYSNGQTADDMLALNNANMMPQTFESTIYCGGGTTTTWVDLSTNGVKPANFWQGAPYYVVSGANTGQSGTITGSTAESGSTPATLSLSNSLTSPCSSATYSNDMLRVGPVTLNPSPATLFGSSLSGTGSWSSDVPPTSISSNQIQSLSLASGNGLNFGLDTGSGQSSNIGVTSGAYIHFNGTYTVNVPSKCLTTCSITVTVLRGHSTGSPTTYLNQTFSPTVSSTSGAGWANNTFSFTASETGEQTSLAVMSITVSGGGTALVSSPSLKEAQVVSANNTVLKDSAFQELQKLNPGVIRFMDPRTWGCPLSTILAPISSRGSCGYSHGSALTTAGSTPVIGLNDALNIGKALGNNTDVWYTVSLFLKPSDYAELEQFLNGSTSTTGGAIRAALGQTAPWTSYYSCNSSGPCIHLEFGNEVWNSPGAGGADYVFGQSIGGSTYGGGYAYGYLAGQVAAAAHADSSYSSAIELVEDGFFGYGMYSWPYDVLLGNTQAGQKMDSIDIAPYTFVASTSLSSPATFQDQYAELENLSTCSASGTPAGCGAQGTVNGFCAEAQAAGVKCSAYEENLTGNRGIATQTQTNYDQFLGGVGAGITVPLMALMEEQNNGMATANIFTLAGPYGGLGCVGSTISATSCNSSSSVLTPTWGINKFMASGSGETVSSANTVDSPSAIAMAQINAAIGTKSLLVNATATAVPTYSVAASQPDPSNSGADSIAANTAAPYLKTFVYSDGTNYSIVWSCSNPTGTCPVTLSGAGAPTSGTTVTLATLGGSTNAFTDNNDQVNIGGTPVVVAPTPTTQTGLASYTVQPGLTTVTYSLSSTPQAAAPTLSPASGTYSAAQTVVPSSTTSGAVFLYCSAALGSTCTPATTYSSGISVASSESLCFVTTASGYSSSSATCGNYTINNITAAPVFTNGTGNYSAAFSTSVTSATSGYAITWGYGSSKIACTPTASYTGPIYVAASEYLCAYATASGSTQSPTTYAAYTFGTTSLPPNFSVTQGTYANTQTVTLTNDTTLPTGTTTNPVIRAQMYYTVDGTTPDATSTPYTGPITVGGSETVKAITQIIGVEQLNSSGATTYWKAPDSTSAGGSGTPTSVSDPTGAAGTGNGENGLLHAGCYSNSGAGPCLGFYMTPQSGTQTNTLWAKSSSIPNSRCDHCTYMLGDHWIEYGTNASKASKFENDDYNWDLTDGYNFQGSSQLCYGSTCGSAAAADVDVGGNASAHWTHTGLHPATTYGVWHHIVKLENTILSELTSKPCPAQTGTSNVGNNWPCIYFDKYNVDGVTGNLQASGMCGQSNGCTLPAEGLGFSVGYATDQFQTDADTSSPANIQQIIDTANFTALYDPSATSSAVYTISTSAAYAPVASPGAGTYPTPQSVTLSSATAGATIYYTIDGTTPTTASLVYSAPIIVGTNETINFFAYKTGLAYSSVISSAYIISAPTSFVTQCIMLTGTHITFTGITWHCP